MTKQVLVLSAHPDDETHCGAMIAREIGAGSKVTVYSCTHCEEVTPKEFPAGTLGDEFRAAAKVLGFVPILGSFPVRRLAEHRQDVLDAFCRLDRDLRPDVVICPSSTDTHQDHEVVYAEARRAFRNANLVLGWDAVNNDRGGTRNVFQIVEQRHLDAKLKAYECYVSQQSRAHTNGELWKALAVVRGKQCRSETGYAEAFELIGMRL